MQKKENATARCQLVALVQRDCNYHDIFVFKKKKKKEEELKSDIHEALLSAGRHFCGPRVTAGSLPPALLAPESCCRALILGCRHYSLLFLLLLLLLGIVQSITDKQAFMGEVGQLSLSLQE